MKIYDYAVIGAGGAGLASAMYAARLGLKTVVFGHTYGSGLPVGGMITTAHIVENYPGFTSTNGVELAKKIKDHADSYDLVDIKQEEVIDIKKEEDYFIVKSKKQEYKVLAILFATGRKLRKLTVKGSKEFEAKGVGYCALCDAPLHKDKTVAVVGGSDSAIVEALILCEYAKKVYILYRGEKVRAEPANLAKMNKNKKIEVINNVNIKEIKGDDKGVNSVILDNNKELKLDAVYIAIGSDPISDLAKKLKVKTNEKQEIVLNHMTSETSVKGVYAAGDVTNKPFKQLITGVAEGVTAAHSAYEYVSEKKLK